MIEVHELEVYYRANYDQLVKRLGRAVGSVMDGEDIVHDAFERALRFRESGSNLERWFSVILSNCLKNHQARARLGGASKPIEECMEELDPVIPDDIRGITKDEIKILYKCKPEQQREMLRLTLEFGYKPSEVVTLMKDVTLRQVNNCVYAFKKEVVERYK